MRGDIRMGEEKHSHSKSNNIAIVFVASSIGAVLGLVTYVKDWL